MADGDLTVQILREIRDDIRGLREEQTRSREEQALFREEHTQFRQDVLARFEVVETTLRDLAEQLVVLGRAVKPLIDTRPGVEERLDDHERRIGQLGKHRSA